MILNPPTPDKIYRESQDSTFQTIIPGKQPKLGLTHGHRLLMYMHSPVGALQNNTLSEIIYLFITPHERGTTEAVKQNQHKNKLTPKLRRGATIDH